MWLANKCSRAPAVLWCSLVSILFASPASHAAGTLTFCMSEAPEGFDIAQYETTGSFDAAVALYDELTVIDPATGRVMPSLAQSWQVSGDGLQYTMELRRNVRFHSTPWFKPTREFNADDVVFSFQRMLDKNHPAHAMARKGFVYWEGMGMTALVKAVDRLGPMTVRFTLTRPEAPFLASLSVSAVGAVLSAEYAEHLRAAGSLDGLNTQPIGTGPFVFKSYQKDAVLRYTSNTAYWAGAPNIDQLVFAITTDPDVRVQRLKAGECMVAGVKNESAQQLSGDPNLNVLVHKPLRTAYLAPNNARPATRDKRLREALWLALDKPALIRAVYGGRAAAAASFLPSNMWGLDATLNDRHDPERAKQLVKASGYRGQELSLFVNADSVSRRAGEFIQADWARVGVKVRLVALELGELYQRTGRGEHDIALLSWESDNGDPDNFLTPNLACAAVEGGGNKVRWCNPAFDALLDAARRTTDIAKRTGLYGQAQRMLYDEIPLIPLVYPEVTTALGKRVQGFVPSPFGLHDFRNVRVK
jgi:dipeptide transport system substrate-binding protein